MDKLCGSLIVSWSPKIHQPGVAGQSAQGTAHDLYWLVTWLDLGRQEVHPEVRLQSNCLRILAAPCPNTSGQKPLPTPALGGHLKPPVASYLQN